MTEQLFQLTVRKGPQPGKVYPLIAERIIVGRDPMSDIALNDPEVSRQHARLVRSQTGYTLEDLGSTNGTFIDGEQLTPGEEHALVHGQIVSMGSGVTLLYEAAGAVEESAAAEERVDAADALASVDDFAADEPSPPPVERELVKTAVPQRETAVPQRGTAVPFSQPEPQRPLVPPGDGNRNQKRRRNIILAVVLLLLLCCCCFVFIYTGYNYWGDPLYQYLLRLLG